MTLKLILTAGALTLATVLPASACPSHTTHTMSCAEGSVWDDQSESCVPQTTS